MSFRIGLLAAFAAAQAPIASSSATSASPGCLSSTLCDAGAVPALVAKLRTAQFAGKPVHILQIGDSHTAGDMITNGLRSRLQARYGHGGRGVLAAGRPYSGYITWGVTASQSPGWSVNGLFGKSHDGQGAPLGLSGFTQSARRPGETLGLATDAPEHDFDRMTVCALTRPGGGTVALRLGDIVQNWSLDAPVRGAACRTLEASRPVSSASITTLDAGPVGITSFGTFRRGGGVVVSNLGVVGAQLDHLNRADDAVVHQELAAYRPDLIVLAYGTNEGFSTRVSGAEYEAALRSQVARIRGHARGVPIMLLGAPDAASRSAAIGSGCGSGWYTPNFLGQVRAIQRRVARELALSFWDWEQAMGGRCAAQTWLGRGLMRGDMVHFTREGGDRIGAMIFADLERAAPAAAAAPAFVHPNPRQESVLPIRRRP